MTASKFAVACGNRRIPMRDLETTELGFVYGAGRSPCPPSPKKEKGNNGFGNGGYEPAPGNSGSTGRDKFDDIVR